MSKMATTASYMDHPVHKRLEKQDVSDLYRWHAVACLVHLTQAVVLFALSDLEKSVDLLWPKYLVWKNPDSKPSRFDVAFALRFEVIPPLFLLFASSHHAVCVYQWFYGDYKERTEQGLAYYCWLEYSISASLMNVLIVVLCGNLDVFVHMFVFVCTAVTMFEGVWIEEAVNRCEISTALWHFLSGCIPFLAVWSVIVSYFADNANGAPDFVYAIVVALFSLESSFAVNTLFYIYSQDVRKYERVKIVLSGVSKSTLAWLVFGGTRGMSRTL